VSTFSGRALCAALAATASAVLLTAPAGAQATSTPARAGAPSLIVFITVDQMRADYFERFQSQLKGGLGRLYRGGAVYLDAHQDHAITETAPGQSVTM
jgi:predicted AlkP superfamily pyrophosphatase or phosphodiesterase